MRIKVGGRGKDRGAGLESALRSSATGAKQDSPKSEGGFNPH